MLNMERTVARMRVKVRFVCHKSRRKQRPFDTSVLVDHHVHSTSAATLMLKCLRQHSLLPSSFTVLPVIMVLASCT